MSATNDEQAKYRKRPPCPDGRHEDPDNSGLCIKCGKPLDEPLGTGYPGAYLTELEGIASKPMEDQRAPMLSDQMLNNSSHVRTGARVITLPMSRREVRDFYEKLITTGELMEPKTAKGMKLPPSDLMWGCEHCQRQWTRMDSFCPGCGARIIE